MPPWRRWRTDNDLFARGRFRSPNGPVCGVFGAFLDRNSKKIPASNALTNEKVEKISRKPQKGLGEAATMAYSSHAGQAPQSRPKYA
jgi:hypothetical protein